MPVFEFTSPMPVPATELYAWHARPGAFERMAPPWEALRVIRRQGTIQDGDRLEMELRMGPIPVRWVAVHRDHQPGTCFTDVQETGPFAFWQHTHRFIPEGEGSLLQDHIEYRLPGGPLGSLMEGIVREKLRRNFEFRHRRLREDLAAHARAGTPPMRVAVTGATGLVGTQLCAFLTTGGHHVHRLVRRAPESGSNDIPWDPEKGQLEPAAMEGFDAVVHLAGENVAGGPWTPERKRRIRESRVKSTCLLAETLARLQQPPKVLVSASAVGFYGDRGDEVLTEQSAPGSGFLVDVSREWENAAAPARDAGIPTRHVRIGIVLSAQGGALPKLVPPFLFGLGGPIGGGRQYMSWIDLDDLVDILHIAITQPDASPVLNGVAPHPVTNAEFGRCLGRVLGRPSFFPLPAAVVRLFFGEMGEAVLLGGNRVLPQALLDEGYRSWREPDLIGSLARQLGRKRPNA